MEQDSNFTVSLEQAGDFQFKVSFDWDGVDELLLDEPEPLGQQKGPNAARILAAAVGNCLSASLFFCLKKSRSEPRSIKARVTGALARNEAGRMRVGGLDVEIRVDGYEGDPARLKRCLDLFQDYCIITESVREGIPVEVSVVDQDGRRIG